MDKDCSKKVHWVIPQTNASTENDLISKNLSILQNWGHNELNEMKKESSSE